jgi:hypothetical protein
MRRSTAAALALLTLAGCAATTRNTPAQPYRSPDGRSAVISGRLDVTDPVFTSGHDLTITIDGQDVIKASIGDGNTDLTGAWNGKKILALCSRERNIWTGAYAIACRVLIDGDFAATLKM